VGAEVHIDRRRNETELERCDRNLVELLQEVRVVQTGAAAAILLIAPTAYHRLLFRCGGKEFLVVVANRLTLAALVAVGLSIIGAMVFVADVLFAGWAAILVVAVVANTCIALWAVLPLARRRELGRRAAHPRA
jgi:Family of unknown function (DUF6328)